MHISRVASLLMCVPFVLVAMNKPVKLTPVTKPAPALVKTTPMNNKLGKELYDLMTTVIDKKRNATPEELQKMRELISQNADINYINREVYNSDNLLVLAIKLGNREIFKLILDKWTNLLSASQALVQALIHGQFEMAELIVNKFGIAQLDKPFVPHSLNDYLIYHYLYAISRNTIIRSPEIEKIRNQYAQQGIGHGNYTACLREEAKKRREVRERRSIEGIKFLIKHNLPSLMNELRDFDQNFTPLMTAANEGLLSVVELLTSSSHEDIKKIGKENTSYLNLLPPDVLDISVKYKKLADIHKKDKKGRTALTIAREAYSRSQFSGSDETTEIRVLLKKIIEYLENLEA